MKAKQDLDKVFGAAGERIEQEVSALLGKNFVVSEPTTELIGKEDFFERLSGKKVIFRLKIEGQVETEGYLLVSLADAIRIGGTLIMLPSAELAEVIERQEYNEELQDSYGEIANIMAGSLTSSFEENYRKSIRLIRKTQEVITPIKVDVESDVPCPNGTYYLVTSKMSMGEESMGEFHLLLPGMPFGLVEPPPKPVEKEVVSEAGEPGTVETTEVSPEVTGQEEKDVRPAEGMTEPPDLQKVRRRLDRLMDECLGKFSQDLSGLLDKEVSLIEKEQTLLNKEEFLDSISGKQVMARMDIRGGYSGQAYMFLPVKDAILLGGTLIMLPESGLKKLLDSEEFEGDTQDAYGEIANITAGVLTAVFEEQSGNWSHGFVRTDLEKLVPMKVDPNSDEVFGRRLYYQLAARLVFIGKELGKVRMLFPADMFGVDRPEATAGEQAAAGIAQIATTEQPPSATAKAADPGREVIAGAQGVEAVGQVLTTVAGEAEVLIYTDNDGEANNMAAFLANMGFRVKIFHFKDSSKNNLLGEVRCIFLVMKEVSEQGFGVAIRINSLVPTVPLVAAGPAWTKTTVLKAVKYGAADIIITPATQTDIRKVLEHNLIPLPA